MIQLNLLPDIKIDYIKGQKLKRLVIGCSLIAVAVSVGLLLLMMSLVAIQKKHISDLDADISSLTNELEDTPNLNNILSVQSQLSSLPQLYDGRPAVDRLPGYLDQTTPVGVRINRLSLDLSASTIEISGKADNLELVNNYVDTLKYTTYTYKDESGQEVKGQPFKDVVLMQFGREESEASYTVTFVFDPLIYDITKEISLTVPSLVTTRVNTPSPDLFTGSNTPTGAQ